MPEWASPDEKRSFHFFQHVTAPSLSGDLDGVFWRVLVLQICHKDPAVRHAVLAVSSLHEALLQGAIAPGVEGASPRQSFALQQYNKAIACLLDQMNDPIGRPMGPLLTCILFVCIEFMQDKERESLIHLEQGRHILSRLDRRADSRDPEIDVIKQHLVPMYTRLSMTSFLFGGTPVPIPQSLKTVKEIPAVFESLQEMRHVLHDFIDRVLRFIQRCRPARNKKTTAPELLRGFEAEQRHLLAQLSRLNVAYSLYRATKPNEASQTTVAVLQMYLHITMIWLSTALATCEAAFDDHLASFSAIVPLAAVILTADTSPSILHKHASRGGGLGAADGPSGDDMAQKDGRQKGPALFTFETHVIPALYYVATKCRHPLVRHAALSLLKRHPSKRENLWRADVIGAIAAHVVKVEERWVQRPDSPSNIHPTAPYTHDCTPEDIWNAGMLGLPVPDDFRADVVGTHLDPSVRMAASFASPARPSGMASPLLDLGQDMDLDMPPPVDPALLAAAEAASSPGSLSGAASSFTPYDDPRARATESAMLFDPGLLLPPQPAMSSRQPASARSKPPSSPSPSLLLTSPSPSPGNRELVHAHAQQQQSTEPPFDLLEHLRIHDTIIGPEKGDGSWVTVFRKLNGLDGDWDVQTSFVRAL